MAMRAAAPLPLPGGWFLLPEHVPSCDTPWIYGMWFVYQKFGWWWQKNKRAPTVGGRRQTIT
jgi:hypothetical protein